jgi:hypothetical protein
MVMDQESYHVIPNDRSILQGIHCGVCTAESASLGLTPAGNSHLEVGLTKLGLQVWCTKHAINVVHIDFRGSMPHVNPNANIRVGTLPEPAEC